MREKYVKISSASTWGLPGLDGKRVLSHALERGECRRADQADWLDRTGSIDARITEWIRSYDGFDDDRYVFVLVAPLGADESWEQTVNGDAFERWSLKDDDKRYGHRTFMTHGRAFMHHRNQDPKKGFGDFPLAIYADRPDRVEAVWRLDREKAKDTPGATRMIDAYLSGQDFPISMGCFLAGQLVTMGDGTVKPIEHVEVGDLVLTHKGRARRVTELHVRPYEGDVYSIRGESGNVIRCTEEHPFWVVDREQTHTAHSKPRWLDFGDVEGQWVDAKCMHPARFLGVQPVPREVRSPDWATRPLARLLGYYLAEGHVVRNKRKEICGVEFTVHEDDIFVREVDALAEAVWSRNEPTSRRRKNSAKALAISIFDAKLARQLYELGGAYARHKRLDAGVMRWHPDLQRELLGAFINGDGHAPRSGAVQWSTASRDLCFQLVQICHRLGLAPSVQSLVHKAGSGFSRSNTQEWVTFLGKTYAQTLRDVCAKIDEVPVPNPRHARRFSNQGLLTPLRDVSRLWMRAEVYNFEVEEDNSYVVEGLAVHNCRVPWDVCSVCGNKAKNALEYCEHPHDPGFGYIYPEDHREHPHVLVRVFNPWPVFKDLSGVTVNAAPEATPLGHLSRALVSAIKGLPKASSTRTPSGLVVPSSAVAAQVHGISERGRALKTSGAPVAMSAMIKHVPALSRRIVDPMIEQEENIPAETLDAMVEASPGPKAVLSSLGALGVVLSADEFRHVLMRDRGAPRHEWAPMASEDILEGFKGPGMGWVEVDAIRPSIVGKGCAHVQDRSILYPHMGSRAVAVHRRDHRPRRVVVTIRGAHRDGPSVGGPTMGCQYGGYLRDMIEGIGSLVHRLLQTLPEVVQDLVDVDGGCGKISSVPEDPNFLLAQAALPTAYIFAKASANLDPDDFMRAVASMNPPEVAHLLGGVFTGETS